MIRTIKSNGMPSTRSLAYILASWMSDTIWIYPGLAYPLEVHLFMSKWALFYNYWLNLSWFPCKQTKMCALLGNIFGLAQWRWLKQLMPRHCQDCNSLITKTQELHWMIRSVGITTKDKPGFLAIPLSRVTNQSLDSTRGGEHHHLVDLHVSYKPYYPRPKIELYPISK
jgi:hypothetical protein